MLHSLTRVFVHNIQERTRLQVGHVHEGDKEDTDDVQVQIESLVEGRGAFVVQNICDG